MPDQTDILNEVVDLIKNEIVQSLHESGRWATGHTAGELQEVVSDNYAALLAPYWIDALENGRKPTPPGTEASDPTLRENLSGWLTARGIPQSAAYAIAKKIHEKGYAGKPGVLTTPLDKVDQIVSDGMNKLGDHTAQELADIWDNFDEG